MISLGVFKRFKGHRVLWIKSNFSNIKVCTVTAYGPTEGEVEEREGFWNNLNRVVDRVSNGYKLLSCVLGDLNGGLGVPGENDFCPERGLSVSNNTL